MQRLSRQLQPVFLLINRFVQQPLEEPDRQFHDRPRFPVERISEYNFTAHFIIPASFVHIECMNSISLGNILRDDTCQAIDNKAVGLQDFVYFPIYIR
jgi:hypothetical protein